MQRNGKRRRLAPFAFGVKGDGYPADAISRRALMDEVLSVWRTDQGKWIVELLLTR